MPSTNTSGRSAGPAADANRLSAAERWLLAAATDPRAIRDRWDRDGVALLPCDALFAAIRIPAAIVHAAAGTTDPAELPGILARLLGGAVFLDPQEGHFYALVEPAAARRWTVEGSVCLWGPEAYLGVPAPERTTGAGSAGAHWAVSPDCLGRRCNSVDVAVLVRAGFTSGHEQVVTQGRRRRGPNRTRRAGFRGELGARARVGGRGAAPRGRGLEGVESATAGGGRRTRHDGAGVQRGRSHGRRVHSCERAPALRPTRPYQRGRPRP